MDALNEIIMSENDENLVVMDRQRLDDAIVAIILQLGDDNSLIDISAEELEKRLSENFVVIGNTLLAMLPELELRHVGAMTQILCATLVKAVPMLQRDYLENVIADGNA